jgi:hypothetical protein
MPEDFEFPQLDALGVWRLWWLGNSSAGHHHPISSIAFLRLCCCQAQYSLSRWRQGTNRVWLPALIKSYELVMSMYIFTTANYGARRVELYTRDRLSFDQLADAPAAERRGPVAVAALACGASLGSPNYGYNF